VNDRLADDRLTAILVRYPSDFVAYDRHDLPFLWIECLEGRSRFTGLLEPLTRMEA
jgi:hypothetical protein